MGRKDFNERLPQAVSETALAGDLEGGGISYETLALGSIEKKTCMLMGIAECAAEKSHVDLLEWCFTMGLRLQPNMTNANLYHQTMYRRSRAIWGILTRNGLDSNVTFSECHGDPFSEAVREGDLVLAEFLLEYGQDPNRAQGSDFWGFWEIGICAILGDQPSRAVESLSLMLRHGWNPVNSRYQSGAAHIAAAKVDHMDALRLLFENGADLELAQNLSWWNEAEFQWYRNVTALFAAACIRHEEAVAYLREKGANPSCNEERRLSCLWDVRQGGNERIVKMIETAGATE